MKPRDHRLFIRGFLGFPAAEPPTASSDLWSAIDARWKRAEFHDLVIRHHHRTPVAVADGDDCSVMLLGDAFETGNGGDASGLLSRLLPGKRWLKRSIAQGLAGSSEAELHQRLLTLSGRFALLVRRGGRTRVYHDPFGSRTVYYLDDGPHAFGSHIELLAAAYGLARSDAVRELVAMPEVSSRPVQYIAGDATLYEGVRGLPPNHFFELATRRVARFWPVAALTATTFDQLFGQLDTYFAALTRFLAGKEIVVGITGGVDGRLILAALLARKARMTGVTWHGSSMWLDPRELPILQAVVRIARITNIPITIPLEDPSEVAALASFNAGRWGFSFTAPMAEIFGHNPRAVFVRGYGGEIMRGFYNFTRVQMVDASPRELMRAYGSSIPQKLRPVSPAYERLCLPLFERWAETTGIEAACRLGYDPNDIFYWEHRMGMWGASMLNELDPAMHNLVGHNSRAVYATCFGLPREERLTKDLFMRLVARYDPRLTEPGYR